VLEPIYLEQFTVEEGCEVGDVDLAGLQNGGGNKSLI
jgi:hypothetical protein